MKSRFKPKFAIKSGDLVVIISGDDKNVTTPKRVLKVFLEQSKVLVEGANIVTKHVKPTAENTKGSIVKIEAPIHISNVMLWDAKAKSKTKVTITREAGKVSRISKKTGEAIK